MNRLDRDEFPVAADQDFSLSRQRHVSCETREYTIVTEWFGVVYQTMNNESPPMLEAGAVEPHEQWIPDRLSNFFACCSRLDSEFPVASLLE